MNNLLTIGIRCRERHWLSLIMCVAFFIAFRCVFLLGWSDHFANIEDFRIAAGAEVVRAAIADPKWHRANVPLLELYPPDHFSLGALGAVLRHACLQLICAPPTPFTFRLELVGTQALTLICWLLWLQRRANSAAMIGMTLLFTLLPPHLLEAAFQATESHATSPLFVALVCLSTDRLLTSRATATPTRAMLLGLICALAVMHLSVLAVLTVIPILALIRIGALRLLPVFLLSAVTGPLLLLYLQIHYEPFYWQAGFRLAPVWPPNPNKLPELMLRHIPRFCGGWLMFSGYLACFLAALHTMLCVSPRQRWRLLLPLLFPFCYFAGYSLSNAEIYEGSRIAHTYKYLTPCLTPLLAFVCLLFLRRGMLPRLLVIMLIVFAGLGYRYWPAPPQGNPWDSTPVRRHGYQQYGELAIQLLDLPKALAISNFIPDDERRALYLQAAGSMLYQRCRSEQKRYHPSLPAAQAALLRAGFCAGDTNDTCIWQERIILAHGN